MEFLSVILIMEFFNGPYESSKSIFPATRSNCLISDSNFSVIFENQKYYQTNQKETTNTS